MLLAPHVEEGRLNVRPFLDRLDCRRGLAAWGLMQHGGWELTWMILREALEEDYRQIGCGGLGRFGVGLDPLRYFRLMSLGPLIDESAVSRVRLDPRLSQTVMG